MVCAVKLLLIQQVLKSHRHLFCPTVYESAQRRDTFAVGELGLIHLIDHTDVKILLLLMPPPNFFETAQLFPFLLVVLAHFPEEIIDESPPTW